MLLADVAQGRASALALERYERERRPVALILVNVTDRAFGVIGRRSRSASVFRNRFSAIGARVIPLLIKTRLGSRIGGYLGQYRIRYRYVSETEHLPEWANDPAVGLRLPPVERNQQALATMTWQLHTYGAGDVSRPDVPSWVEGPHTFGADPQRRLGSDRLYLVRPDQFVAASIPLRGRILDADQLQAAMLAHCLNVG
jgi:hypothetical protein